ncbi:MAG: peptide MFS transporter [Saprospiraceae bacterium]|nr:peptide MFS transporter [Saprospiraceae bacterium]
MDSSKTNFFDTQVLGHPAGLFVLFFTEMWERFSFYGMRVLLVNFLTMAVVGVDFPGWGWTSENAGALFGTYAGLLYLTPILGGLIADKVTGYRWAVVIGAAIMTIGHAAMAFETETSLYVGLALLVIGTGFFKPNMTSIVSEMYKDFPEKKDGAYTIFYMGVNAGAFFGMMLCGYLAETVGWAWGFGLAGIFMALGTLQFWLAKPIFGIIGDPPIKSAGLGAERSDGDQEALDSSLVKDGEEPTNPFTTLDKILIAICSIVAFVYLINDPLSKIKGVNLLPEAQIGVILLITLALFLYLVISRMTRYTKITRDRMIAFVIFAFFTVFFWMAFEQGATSLVLFARDFTQRSLVGEAATAFKIVDTLLTVVPLGIITWVLYLLFTKTFKTIRTSNIVLALSFLAIWIIVGYKLVQDFSTDNAEITVSWFSILNSFFIITFASFFTKWWDSKYNPSAAIKYGLGLGLLGIGFGILAFGSLAIPAGTEAGAVRVSMIWLILAYLFHTLGELCLSPVGLSYVSKLVPARMIAFMFGMWYLAIAIGNKLAAKVGGMFDTMRDESSLSFFFLIFTIIPIVSGILVTILGPVLKKLMHGVK